MDSGRWEAKKVVNNNGFFGGKKGGAGQEIIELVLIKTFGVKRDGGRGAFGDLISEQSPALGKISAVENEKHKV